MTTRRRASDRKQARMIDTSHPGLPGRSIRDKIQDDLDVATRGYMLVKDSEGSDSGDARMMRGKMRGLAIALAHMSVDLEYRPTPLELEKATIRRLRNDG